VEKMVIPADFWRGKSVLVTGHTGFKGSWLSLWLASLGARVTGYALAPPTSPSLFDLADIARCTTSIEADVRDLPRLQAAVREARPQVVFHLAAQSLVRPSYQDPVGTYATNVMGTVNVLEAVRAIDGVQAVVVVTSDKCYENREWLWGYREDEAMGGYDPYSSSKGCAELVASAYRRSFMSEPGTPGIASARAGNVIGGGDWAQDRLIPDILRAFSERQVVQIRSPQAVRPWQHVLEPLSGYIRLAERVCLDASGFSGAWNFGPSEHDTRSVEWIVERMRARWGEGANWQLDGQPQPHEARYLKLDCSKAHAQLGWWPTLELEQALDLVVDWHRAYLNGENMAVVTQAQIERFRARQS
jgi:CDP-glucose 4,6-dehydratase